LKRRFVENFLPPAATFLLTTAAAEFGIRAAGISPLAAGRRRLLSHAPHCNTRRRCCPRSR